MQGSKRHLEFSIKLQAIKNQYLKRNFKIPEVFKRHHNYEMFIIFQPNEVRNGIEMEIQKTNVPDRLCRKTISHEM